MVGEKQHKKAKHCNRNTGVTGKRAQYEFVVGKRQYSFSMNNIHPYALSIPTVYGPYSSFKITLGSSSFNINTVFPRDAKSV